MADHRSSVASAATTIPILAVPLPVSLGLQLHDVPIFSHKAAPVSTSSTPSPSVPSVVSVLPVFFAAAPLPNQAPFLSSAARQTLPHPDGYHVPSFATSPLYLAACVFPSPPMSAATVSSPGFLSLPAFLHCHSPLSRMGHSYPPPCNPSSSLLSTPLPIIVSGRRWPFSPILAVGSLLFLRHYGPPISRRMSLWSSLLSMIISHRRPSSHSLSSCINFMA